MSIFSDKTPMTERSEPVDFKAMPAWTSPMRTVVDQAPVKSAQSTMEQRHNYGNAINGDDGARSIVHVERPRYGHKV